MPIYEYLCTTCHQTFDVRRGVADADRGAACPMCGAAKAQRVVSSFVAFSSAGGQRRAVAGSSPCAGCAPVGGCAGCGLK
jgi:putative FmdB family regulatory protein